MTLQEYRQQSIPQSYIQPFVVLMQINNRTYLTETSIPQKHTIPTLLTNLATLFYEKTSFAFISQII
jgi:hypothetical protein